MPKVTLVSCDDKRFSVDMRLVMKSSVMKTMYESLPCAKTSEANGEIIIIIPVDIQGHILKEAIIWIEKQLAYDKASMTELLELGPLEVWNKGFFAKLETETLEGLLCAANYLDIRSLMVECCKRVATLLRGKSLDDIRAQYGIKSEFTKAERRQIQMENRTIKKLLKLRSRSRRRCSWTSES